MTERLTLDAAPDLRRVYAGAVRRRGSASDRLPEVEVVRRGVRTDVAALARYAHLCGFTLGGTLPTPYPHVLAFPLQMVVMGGEGFPLPLLGAVHVENTVTVARPVGVEEVLDVAVHAADLRPHRRGRQVDLVSEVRASGELVWRGVSTYLARGTEHPDAPASGAPSLERLAGVHAGPQWRFGAGTGRSYASVSGDWNPIHVHALTARPLGFPTAIAHGMYSWARVVAALGPRLPGSGLTSRVWFRKPVRLPSTVRLRTAFDATSSLSVLESAGSGTEHAVVENRWEAGHPGQGRVNA